MFFCICFSNKANIYLVLYCHAVFMGDPILYSRPPCLVSLSWYIESLFTRWVMEGRGGRRGSLKMHCFVWVHGEGEADKLVWVLGRNPWDVKITSTVSWGLDINWELRIWRYICCWIRARESFKGIHRILILVWFDLSNFECLNGFTKQDFKL